MFGPNLNSTLGSATLPNRRRLCSHKCLLSKWYVGFVYCTSTKSVAGVRTPLFAAVAAIERASISATEAS